MDFSRLSQAERLAVFGSIAVIIGGVIGSISGLFWLAILAAIAMLVVVFLPTMSPTTTLPGSKGSLMAVCGFVAGAAGVLALLTVLGLIGFWFSFAAVQAILFLIAVAGSLVMAWAGWQALQAEGGRWVLGTTGATSGTARMPGETREPMTGGTAGTATEPTATTSAEREAAVGADVPPRRDIDDEMSDEERRAP
jgi:hypothetical protein